MGWGFLLLQHKLALSEYSRAYVEMGSNSFLSVKPGNLSWIGYARRLLPHEKIWIDEITSALQLRNNPPSP